MVDVAVHQLRLPDDCVQAPCTPVATWPGERILAKRAYAVGTKLAQIFISPFKLGVVEPLVKFGIQNKMTSTGFL